MKKYQLPSHPGSVRNNGGFSTILALLLTGFLVTLTAGILFLFLSENRINLSLFSGTAAYHASEGAMEYALLKIKNHREGFSDGLSVKADEAKAMENNTPRAARIGYEIISTGTSYSGVLAPESFEIVPLFYEAGKPLKTEEGKVWKDPRNPMKGTPQKAFGSRVSTPDFSLNIVSGDQAVWNVIGNDTTGATFGVSGILYSVLPSAVSPGIQAQQGTLSMSSLGNYRTYSGGVLSESTKPISAFLASYVENYLVMYNPSHTDSVEYSISASAPFALPKTQIVASGKVMDSIINLQMTEDKSRLYDILKYSLFVPDEAIVGSVIE
jgi:hypothetical protein